MTYRQARDAFGPATRTLERWARAVRATLPAGAVTPAAVNAAAGALQFTAPGAKPLLLPQESALLMAKAASGAQVGVGSSRKALSASARRVAHALAASLPRGSPGALRLQSAKFGPKWQRGTLKRLHKDGLVSLKEVKPANLSQKRAAAGASGLTDAMFDKFIAHDKELYDKHILKTPHPRPDQVFNGDEVGEDPTGARARVSERAQTCMRIAPTHRLRPKTARAHHPRL
jgi:hypothetical protein